MCAPTQRRRCRMIPSEMNGSCRAFPPAAGVSLPISAAQRYSSRHAPPTIATAPSWSWMAGGWRGDTILVLRRARSARLEGRPHATSLLLAMVRDAQLRCAPHHEGGGSVQAPRLLRRRFRALACLRNGGARSAHHERIVVAQRHELIAKRNHVARP